MWWAKENYGVATAYSYPHSIQYRGNQRDDLIQSPTSAGIPCRTHHTMMVQLTVILSGPSA